MSSLERKPKALIIVAGVINYYYDVIGYRLAEALKNIGFHAEVCTLKNYQDHEYDWLFMVNIFEIAVGYGNIDEAMRRIMQIKARANFTAMVLLECVKTNWFAENLKLCQQANVDVLLDLGFHDQRADAPPKAQRIYRFIFNGLTNYERHMARQMEAAANERPIPWAFIGHLETRRVRFVQRLMGSLEANGFVYLPVLTHVVETGPHINGQQLQAILERTRWYIWNAHHDYFYMESERFRNALMAGAVPIKVSNFPPDPNTPLPFRYLQLNEENFDDVLRTYTFESTLHRFVDEYCALPSLESEMSKLFTGEMADARLHA